MPSRLRILAVVACAALVLVTAASFPAHADGEPRKDPRDLQMLRFEFDNDTFLGSDDVFSAGWSIQYHSRLADTWAPGYAGWIGRIPGLGDDGRGRRIARWAYGIGQIIITPKHIDEEVLLPDEVPYAGILGLSASYSAYDNERLAALQFFVGCMGPCAGGEAVQKFIHKWVGDPVNGWDNQLADQGLINVNYEYLHKVKVDTPESYAPGEFAHDVALGAQFGLGNLTRFVWGQVEYRFGWGLPQGFARSPDPPGIGIMLDPVYVDPLGPRPLVRPWRSYFTIIGRASYIGHFAPAEGGDTANGLEHPGLDDVPGQVQALLGYHLTRVPFALHVTYYKYFEKKDSIDGGTDWINLSFEWRF